MDRLATIEPEGDDRFGAVLAAHGAHRTASLVIAVAGTLSTADTNALAGLSSRATVILVATRSDDYRPLARAGVIVVDAATEPFPVAWNRAITECHLAPPPQSSPARSPR
jgi:hypothetical protein